MDITQVGQEVDHDDDFKMIRELSCSVILRKRVSSPPGSIYRVLERIFCRHILHQIVIRQFISDNVLYFVFQVNFFSHKLY